MTTFLFQLRKLLHCGLLKCAAANEIVRPLAIYFEHLSALPIADILHNTHSSLGNEVSSPGASFFTLEMACNVSSASQSNSPAHHLMHGHMEWRWFYLTIKLKIVHEATICNQISDEPTFRSTEAEKILQNFIHDLILMSAAKFNKLPVTELPTKTPFVCVCHKELWLMLQLLIEKNGGRMQMEKFWFYFNHSFKLYRERKGFRLRFNSCLFSSNNSVHSFLDPYSSQSNAVTRDSHAIYPNDFVLFGIWLLNGVNNLLGFTESGYFQGAASARAGDNFELLESLLRSFTSAECAEQNLRACLIILGQLLTEWWIGKPELLMIFWEYFHKKLNSTFFVSNAAPNSIAVTSSTAQGYIDQVHKLLDANGATLNMASFSIFSHLLGKMLKKLQQTDMKSQMQKIMGKQAA